MTVGAACACFALHVSGTAKQHNTAAASVQQLQQLHPPHTQAPSNPPAPFCVACFSAEFKTPFLQGIRRTSNLLAPIMQLVGHGGEVLGMRFSPDGQTLASASADRTLLLWRTYDECENFMMLRGHKNAVLEVHWFRNGETLLSCSADKSVRCWDTEAGVQVGGSAVH